MAGEHQFSDLSDFTWYLMDVVHPQDKWMGPRVFHRAFYSSCEIAEPVIFRFEQLPSR